MLNSSGDPPSPHGRRRRAVYHGVRRAVGSLLETVSYSHGSILNISNVARESQVERKVVEGYVGILEDLLLAYRVPVFSKRAMRSPASHPKFYFFDTGLYSVLRPSGPLDRAGEAVEGLVGQHLRAWIDYRHPGAQLFYWRTSAGSEVDFILYGKDMFWAVEVKNGKAVHPQDLRGLKAFGEDYPGAKRFLLYRGSERLVRDGISIVPCADFLLGLG